MLKYDVVAEHYDLDVKPEYLEYIEQFYLRKLLAGVISLSSVWRKLQDIPFSNRTIQHMFNHIKHMLENMLERKVIERKREKILAPKLSYKRKQRLSYLRVKTGVAKREQYSANRAWVHDKHGRVHHINIRTGRFTRIPKHLRRKK